MSYGKGSYGATPYGGFALSSGGPQLVSSDPAASTPGVQVDAPVSFVLTSDADLDTLTLNVFFSGSPAILAGMFLPGFAGTIDITPNPTSGTTASVTVSTHPDLPDGQPVTVQIDVRDVATNPGSFSFVFYTSGGVVDLTETVLVSETLTTTQTLVASLTESLPVVEEGEEVDQHVVVLREVAPVYEALHRATPESIDSYTVEVPIAQEVLYDGVADLANWSIYPLDGGVPLTLREVLPEVDGLATGSSGSVGTSPGSPSLFASVFYDPTAAFSPDDIGNYIEITGPATSTNFSVRVRIADFVDPTCVGVTPALNLLDPAVGGLTWRKTSAVRRVRVKTSKVTDAKRYEVSYRNLLSKHPPALLARSAVFVAQAAYPRLESAKALADGSILVTFAEDMRLDPGLVRLDDYVISGPSSVRVESATVLSSRQILLRTIGVGEGAYTLTINASGTPHDLAGNPIDASYNLGAFSGTVPLNSRSIFVDKGPIAKPPLTLQEGAGAMISSVTDVTCPGAAFDATTVGRYLTIAGGVKNGGTFLVTGVVSPTRVRLQASFSLPDSLSGSLSWTLFDPRNGQIADNPTDVVVKVNGTPVQAEAVLGLLGQIVLPTAPTSTDTVDVDYSWVRDPSVEIRALNNTAFALNGHRRTDARTQHNYAYRCLLVRPHDYLAPVTTQAGSGAVLLSTTTVALPGAALSLGCVGMKLTLASGPNAGEYIISGIVNRSIASIVGAFEYPDATTPAWSLIDPRADIQARLDQPLLRDIKYRAYERAYTAVLNDPNLLLLNSPSQKIAFPPLKRQVTTSFIRFDGDVLPEASPDPWTRAGTGTATIVDNQLVVGDTTTGPFPEGEPIYWTRPLDLTFEHVFAAAWRFSINKTPTVDGVFTGVAAGYSNSERAVVIGFLEVAGTRKFGILKKGFGNDPSTVSAWAGGTDAVGSPTGQPADIDWSLPHSYRLYRDKSGVVRVFVDGEVVETLCVTEEDLPSLAELDDPFNAIQGSFFGSLSREARSTSTWSFVRYTVLPTNPVQSERSSFVSYEATQIPENSNPPWTPVGYHGTETITGGDHLLLDSTSATTAATEERVGLVGGDFRGYVRLEPLLSVSSDVVLDLGVHLRTFTHGVSPNSVMAAIDDGDRLIQVSFFPDKPSSKFSYGGRCLPEAATPIPWQSLGSATTMMVGRTLRISDTSTLTGRVYYIDDTTVPHVASNDGSYAMEFRAQVRSYEIDADGFAGVTGQMYDTARSVGVLLREVDGVRYVAAHSDGVPVPDGMFAFEWFDGEPHTYKFVVVPASNVVSIFADAVLLGSVPYSSFSIPSPIPNGVISWGSATPASTSATSVVDWMYANAWRVYEAPQRFVGIWKGTSDGALTDFHLPLKAQGRGALAIGNAIGDEAANFLASGVTIGDYLIVDEGPNRGVYEVTSVAAQTLTVATPFAAQPSRVSYRIPKQVDWSADTKFRLVRDPGGGVTLSVVGNTVPLIRLGYNAMDLPPSTAGIVRTLSGGLPAIAFGAFDPTNLSQSAWDFVRYGITRAPVEMRAVPPHQVLNQRNAISSPEHLRTKVAHDHTGFWSSSTGIPPQGSPDFMQNPAVAAYTRLNQGTPPVPLTQTFEARHPTPVLEPISALNRPSDVLNNNGTFRLNDATTRVRLLVPDDVLYNSLQLVETTQGVSAPIAPFTDAFSIDGAIQYQSETCLVYDGTVLPELDPNASTPWVIQSDNPSEVARSAFSSVLTYGTLSGGTRSVYRNMTPLPDAPGLQTEFTFRIRLLNDASGGLGDSQVRFGFSAPGLTLGLGLVTVSSGERYVIVYDLNADKAVGGVLFDFLDGAFHDYRLVRDPSEGLVHLFIDS